MQSGQDRNDKISNRVQAPQNHKGEVEQLTIRNVLRRDRVKQLRANGDSEVGEVAKKLSSKTETFVDLERAIDIGVVDESFPANGGAGFLNHTKINHCRNGKNVRRSNHLTEKKKGALDPSDRDGKEKK